MNIANIITAICSLLFLMIGVDKFFPFLEPPCSLAHNIPWAAWSALGALQIAAGILIWLPKFKKYVVGFFFIFMLFFTIVHVSQGTYDIGGSTFMAMLLGLLVWNPSFIRGKES
jgi:hypothetical protein